MNFERIILCTDAPEGQGLAYYYYRALCDIMSPEKIAILDDGNRNYGAGAFERGVRRAKLELGLLPKLKYQRILDHLISGRKNIVMVFNNADLKKEEIAKLSDHPDIYLISYLSDSPYGLLRQQQKELFTCIPYFDMVFTFAEALIPVLYQLGAKTVGRIPFGYCKYTHLEPTKNIEPAHPNKIYYFGTWTPPIEHWLSYLDNFDLEIEGNGWARASSDRLRQIGTKKKPNTDHNMAILARKAGLVVNFTRAPHGCFHTMKTFELTVAGACVLSNYSKEQNDFFSDNRSMVYFNTASELIDNAKDLVLNTQKNMLIRNNAIEDAKKHSYHERAKTLVDFLKFK